MKWTEDNLEAFIKENRDKFDKYVPESNHEEHFLIKLLNRFKKIISIVPHLIKVITITIIIFVCSFLIWKAYLCPPLTHVSLKNYKIEHLYIYKIHQQIKILSIYINTDSVELNNYNLEMKNLNNLYDTLNINLRKNPSNDNIMNMQSFYETKLKILNARIEYFQNKLNY